MIWGCPLFQLHGIAWLANIFSSGHLSAYVLHFGRLHFPVCLLEGTLAERQQRDTVALWLVHPSFQMGRSGHLNTLGLGLEELNFRILQDASIPRKAGEGAELPLAPKLVLLVSRCQQ